MTEDSLLAAIRPVAQALGLPQDYRFDGSPVLSREEVAELTALRTTRPEYISKALASRPRRPRLTEDGRLVILAADHPARMVTSVGTDPLRMANRADYLARIVRVLSASPVDGLMATPDVLEDVVALDALRRDRGHEGFLGRRVLIGSMNRSGLQNAAHELWDMPSAYVHARHLAASNLDGGKVLWRYAPEGEANRESLETMAAVARLAAEMAEAGLPLFIEPLAVESKFDKWLSSKAEADWVRVVGAASGLGPSTARTWLKIPFIRPYERIVAATTLPVLMLGGPASGVPAALLVDFADGMKAGPAVCGALVGRNILYPGADDPALVARAVCHVVHDRLTALDAARRAAEGGRL